MDASLIVALLSLAGVLVHAAAHWWIERGRPKGAVAGAVYDAVKAAEKASEKKS